MHGKIRIKNCGMGDAVAIATSVETGASFIGFIHYPKSKRFVTYEQAVHLSEALPDNVASVAVMVNPTNEDIAQASYATHIQLHGDETVERVAEVKALAERPTIKALGVHDAGDVFCANAYQEVADMLLFDTKHADYGGTGTAFDWSLLQGLQLHVPWFLSGGLDAMNVAQALAQTHAPMVDVSSGIESQSGVKDPDKIIAFNQAVENHER